MGVSRFPIHLELSFIPFFGDFNPFGHIPICWWLSLISTARSIAREPAVYQWSGRGAVVLCRSGLKGLVVSLCGWKLWQARKPPQVDFGITQGWLLLSFGDLYVVSCFREETSHVLISACFIAISYYGFAPSGHAKWLDRSMNWRGTCWKLWPTERRIGSLGWVGTGHGPPLGHMSHHRSRSFNAPKTWRRWTSLKLP